MQRIYLDHNATSPLLAEAAAAQLEAQRTAPGNPSSVHWHGRQARCLLDAAREQVADLIAGDPEELVFTAGATESNHLAVLGIVPDGGQVITTAVEHPSVLAPCERISASGGRVTRLPVDREGRVDPAEVVASIRPETALISVQMANQETGVIQDIAAIAAAARAAGVVMHTDAVQAVGRIPVDADGLGVDLLTLSAHKLGGPMGIGALWVREGLGLRAQTGGGRQERSRRSGTENVPAAAGFGAAADLARQAVSSTIVGRLRDDLESSLQACWPGAVLHGRGATRIPNTLSMGFPGLDGEAALMCLDLEGVSVSLGSACSVGTMEPSPVLLAMGVTEELARSSLRFSLGPTNSGAEVRRALEVFATRVAPAEASAGVGESS